jgi:hypothetical protein
MFFLLPLGLSTMRATAQPAACTAAPVQVDETVARLHMIKVPVEFQDNVELWRLAGGKMGVPRLEMSQMSVLLVEIDSTGKTTDVKTISGMHEYSNVFADILKRVSYVPFKKHNEAVCVQYVYKVPTPPEPRSDWSRFHLLIQKCVDLSRIGAGPEELISACQQAADAGDLLPVFPFAIDKRLAFVMTATALMKADRAKEALSYADKAVETADLGFDDVTGKAAAYGVRGQARGLTGDLKGANEDLTKAEELERATFEVPRKPEQKAFNTHALKSMLGFHAEVLNAMHEKAEADKLRDEAKKL